MKILMVTREYPPFIIGGVATHTYNLVKALRSLGIDVDVLSFGDPRYNDENTFYMKPSSSIISKRYYGIGSSLAVIYDIYRYKLYFEKLINERGYDLVHVQEPYIGGYIRYEHKVTTIHDTSYGEIKSIFSSLTRRHDMAKLGFYITLGYLQEYFSIATSRVVIVPSPQVREEIIYKYRIGREKIIVIPNGVDPRNKYWYLSRDEAKEKLDISRDKLLVFTTSQHVARKRLDIFILAVKILDHMGMLERVSIVIGGDGPLRPYLEELAYKLGLRNKIVFTGWLSRDQLELYYRATDIFVISSDYEAGPITMLEAMINGAAVVSTNIKGFPSMLSDRVEALLVKPGDPLSLAMGIRELVVNDDLREKLSINGRRFASKHTWDRVARKTLMVYERVLEN